MVKNVNGEIYSDLITVARPESFWSGGSRDLSAVRYIVIHGTATTSVTGAYSTWLTSRNNQTSANYLVTDDDIMGCLGENMVAWHCGGTAGITNQNSIGIEHINSSIGNYADANTYLFSDKTIDNGARLTADICKRLGLAPNAQTIVPHRSVSSTACPQTLNMDEYINRVQAYFNGQIEAQTILEQSTTEENMFTVSCKEKGYGIGLIAGGRWFSLLDGNDPDRFWKAGVKNITVSAATFKELQKVGSK